MTATAKLTNCPDDEALADVPAAARLGICAALLVAMMPVAMTLANRSAPLLLALAGATALASAAAECGWASAGSRFAAMAHSNVAKGTAAFIALSLLSYVWSVDRAQTLRTLEEGAVPLIAGTALLLFLPRVAPRWTGLALAAGVILAAIICIGELRLGMPLRNALHLRAQAFEYNRPVLTLLALCWPLCALAVSRCRHIISSDPSSENEGPRASSAPEASRGESDNDPSFRPLENGASLTLWLALAVTTLAIWGSQSGTAMFAQAASVTAALLAWRFPRISLVAAATAVSLVFTSIFAFGDIAWRLLPEPIYNALAWAHAADRVEIWRSFGAAALFHPILGTGLGTSVTLGDTAVVGEVASEFRRMLSVGHPHNGYLQIGVELGAVGCVIAAAIALMMLWRFRRFEGAALWSRVGLFTMIAATMLVGHGAWQAWWIAVIFVSAALVRTLVPPRDRLPLAQRKTA
jgi:hypothetical protein